MNILEAAVRHDGHTPISISNSPKLIGFSQKHTRFEDSPRPRTAGGSLFPTPTAAAYYTQVGTPLVPRMRPNSRGNPDPAEGLQDILKIESVPRVATTRTPSSLPPTGTRPRRTSSSRVLGAEVSESPVENTQSFDKSRGFLSSGLPWGSASNSNGHSDSRLAATSMSAHNVLTTLRSMATKPGSASFRPGTAADSPVMRTTRDVSGVTITRIDTTDLVQGQQASSSPSSISPSPIPSSPTITVSEYDGTVIAESETGREVIVAGDHENGAPIPPQEFVVQGQGGQEFAIEQLGQDGKPVATGESKKPGVDVSLPTPTVESRSSVDSLAPRPISGKTDRPTSGKPHRPTSGKADRPTSRKADRPTSGKTDRPASGKADNYEHQTKSRKSLVVTQQATKTTPSRNSMVSRSSVSSPTAPSQIWGISGLHLATNDSDTSSVIPEAETEMLQVHPSPHQSLTGSTASAAADNLVATLKRLTEELRAEKEYSQKLSQQLAAVSAERNRLQDARDAHEMNYETVRNELAHTRAELAQTTRELTTVKKRLADTEAQSPNAAAFIRMEADMQQMERLLAAAKQAAEVANNQAREQTKATARAQERIDELLLNLKDVQAEKAELENTLRLANEKNKTLHSEIARLQKTIDELKATNQESTLAAQNRMLVRELEQREEEWQRAGSRITSLELELEELQVVHSQCGNVHKEVTELQRKLVDVLNKARRTDAVRAEQFKAMLDKKNGKIAEVRRENAEQRVALELLSKQAALAQQQISSLKLRLSTVIRERDELRAEIENFTRRADSVSLSSSPQLALRESPSQTPSKMLQPSSSSASLLDHSPGRTRASPKTHYPMAGPAASSMR